MIWWPFAPKPEKADTLEVTDLYSDAPPLYSTTFVAKVSFSSLVAALPREYSRSVKPDEPEFLNANLSGGNVQESAAD